MNPTTISDLERRAGVEQTQEARETFWKPFSHLGAGSMLEAGRAELKRRIHEREAAEGNAA